LPPIARRGSAGSTTQVHPEQVELIHDLAQEGKSHRTIAHLTGLSRAQVGRVLRGEIASLHAYQPQDTHHLLGQNTDQDIDQGRTA
jgi:DNA invertase Pin-like site-specific DNA recombinase